jgi:carbonic anhydrase
MFDYNQIFENNKNWVKEKKGSNADFFKYLTQGQNPDYLFIGCSDSRVTAEELMGAQPGEVFVHRNVANLVPNNDNNSASVVEYAVDYLNVKHIVICGHYFCGGIKAAMQNKDMGALNPWLRNIRDVYRLHAAELHSISDENEKYKRLVELNVQEQCLNVLKMSTVQNSIVKGESPEVHGWVFDMESGHLIDLKIDYKQILSAIVSIYDLTK